MIIDLAEQVKELLSQAVLTSYCTVNIETKWAQLE